MTKKNSTKKKAPPTYLERTKTSIAVRGEPRGIPAEESGSVIAAIEKKFGKKLDKMSDRELVRVSQALDEVFTAYLDGAKRR
jgi:hypothetical protein